MADLLVLGPGRLGIRIAQKWQSEYPSSNIYLKFKSENPERSKEMLEKGFKVLSEGSDIKVNRVVFCAPPHGNPDYPADVEQGFSFLKSKGILVFTSSGSVYKENNGGEINEDSELARTERSSNIIDAETVVINKGGCVVRLGGLYSEDTGVHNYYSRGGEFQGKPDGLINFIHYQDAASAVVSCLQSPEKVGGEVLLVGDGISVSRNQIVQYIQASTKYGGGPEIKFTGGDGVDGKKYNCSKIKNLLSWKPEYPSFKEFITNL